MMIGIVLNQVSRMLLGGMKVVGIYVWASDTAFKNSTMILCQVTLWEISCALVILFDIILIRDFFRKCFVRKKNIVCVNE